MKSNEKLEKHLERNPTDAQSVIALMKRNSKAIHKERNLNAVRKKERLAAVNRKKLIEKGRAEHG